MSNQTRPWGILGGAKLLQQAPENCVVFEDAAAGIAAAAAGMTTIGMGADEVKTADHCFDTMDQITTAFIRSL